MKSYDITTKVIIVIIVLLNIILAIRVATNIAETGVIRKEISPDGKYEVVINREKHPTMDGYGEYLDIELYDKSTGQLISYMESEQQTNLAMHPTFNFSWLEEGVYVEIHVVLWLDGYTSCYILPYE